jgi:hypothetical protein
LPDHPKGEQFFELLDLRVADPVNFIMRACINLSRKETGSGALEWFATPLIDLGQWARATDEMDKRQKR